ncbi:MAG: hypothetical protein H0X53_01800, partial [Sphingomonas sp.]|nr:hypothetical protein [Sphingomonas sp.]
MINTRWIAAVSLLAVSACSTVPASAPLAATQAPLPPPNVPVAAGPLAPVVHETNGLAKLATIQMRADASFLSAEERQVVNLLIQAADLMNPIYLRQRSTRNPAIRAEIEATGNAALLDMFDLHFGPWDSLAENHPFYGNR